MAEEKSIMRKKSLFLFFLGILGFVLSFWMIQPVTKVSAVTCIASCNKGNFTGIPCGNRCWFTGPHADPGATPQGACSVGTAIGNCDPIAIFDTTCTSAEMSCNERNCSGINKPTGTACKISRAYIDIWNVCTMDTKDGVWDNTRKQCVECVGAGNQGYVWGSSTTVAYTTPPLQCKEVCGGPAAQDGNASCAVAVCDSVPVVEIIPASYTGVAGSNNVFTIKVTNNEGAGCPAGGNRQFDVIMNALPAGWTAVWDGTAINALVTNAVTPVITGAGGTNSSVKVKITSSGAAAAANYPFIVKVSVTGKPAVNVSKTGTYTITTCSGGTFVKFTSASYLVGSTFNTIQWGISPAEPTNDYIICLYNPGGANVWDTNQSHFAGSGDIGSNNAQSASVVGTWTVSMSIGVACPGAPTGCIGSAAVTAPACVPNGCGGGCPASCTGTDDPDCAGTCLDAGCASDTDCAAVPKITACSAGCGAFCTTRIGNSYTGGCTNSVFQDICNPAIATDCATCSVTLSAGGPCDCNTFAICTGACTAVGGACVVPGDCCSGNCDATNVCAPAPGCTADGGTCAVAGDCCSGTCTGGVCVAAIVGVSCSGPGMFVSPLGPGYCTIGEILTNATNWILSLVASIIILIIVIGGLMYISAGGDEEKLRTSKNVIYYAMVGLGIILISYALITEVTTLLK